MQLDVPATVSTSQAVVNVPSAHSKAEVDVKLPVPADRLLKWNVAMLIFHSFLAIITLVVGNGDLRVPIYGSSVALTVLENNTRSWAMKPATDEKVGWFYLTYLVALFFALSAAAHGGNAFVWKAAYLRNLEQAYAPFRWIEYSFSASVMVIVLSYVAGVRRLSSVLILPPARARPAPVPAEADALLPPRLQPNQPNPPRRCARPCARRRSSTPSSWPSSASPL